MVKNMEPVYQKVWLFFHKPTHDRLSQFKRRDRLQRRVLSRCRSPVRARGGKGLDETGGEQQRAKLRAAFVHIDADRTPAKHPGGAGGQPKVGSSIGGYDRPNLQPRAAPSHRSKARHGAAVALHNSHAARPVLPHTAI